MLSAVLARRQAGPLAEGTEEHTGFGVAQQQGDFRRWQAAVAQVLLGQLAACVGQQLRVAAALFGQPALQGAFAQVQLTGQFCAIGLAMRQLFAELADNPRA